MDIKSRNGKKFEIFFRTFWPPCRIALADLDGSTPEYAQVCALHIELHLEALRKIEMVAVHCTNETPRGREGARQQCLVATDKNNTPVS